MKVAIPCNKEKMLVPLDQAELIVLYNDEQKMLPITQKPKIRE